MKLHLIRLADWFDDHILQHRLAWICTRIGNSDWWGNDDEGEPINEWLGIIHEIKSGREGTIAAKDLLKELDDDETPPS